MPLLEIPKSAQQYGRPTGLALFSGLRSGDTTHCMRVADLPIVDLDQSDRAATLARGLFETGFFHLRDHAIPPELLAAIRSETRSFFRKPMRHKMEFRGTLRGYAALREEHTAAAFGSGESDDGDLCEKFSMGAGPTPAERAAARDYFDAPEAQRFFQPNQFPNPAFAEVWQDYFNHMVGLSERLMMAVRETLGLPAGAWDQLIDKPANLMRFLNYPEVADSAVRMAAHYDDNLLTLLHQSPLDNGFHPLEVMLPGDDVWRSVPADDDLLVVNVGEALMYLSQGRIIATKHRVAATPPEQRHGSARTSIAFFHTPNWNCPLHPVSPRGVDGRLGQNSEEFGRGDLYDPDGSIPYYRLQDRALSRGNFDTGG